MADAPWQDPLPPFSFSYDGRPSSSFLSEWTTEEMTEPAADGETRVRTWRDPATGLRVTARIRTYASVPATDWVLEFANDGAADTPIISDILPLDRTWARPEANRVVLHRSKGSLCQIDDFIPQDQDVHDGWRVEMAPENGRSSNGVMPFMNVEFTKYFGPQSFSGFTMPDITPSGFVLAIGWSGQWKAVLHRKGAELHVTAGMERTHLRLHPGEKVRSPRIVILPWEGEDAFAGNNLLRRLILAHYTPKTPSGEPHTPPIAHMRQLVYYFTGQATEEDHLRAVERASELGIEAFWIDALWYGGGVLGEVDWGAQVGNWKVRTDRFPRGLKPIADAAHERGLKFVLWFEPERVHAGTEIAREHPDYVLRRPGDDHNFLFDLGNPDARRHILELISTMIGEVGIDVYRQDCNIDPLAYWRAADEPDRVGMHEIRHIEGLYALWDTLRARHPGLSIDNCASGGRRIDIETTARSYPLWRSDYTDVVALHAGYWLQLAAQCQVSGLSRWVPLHAAATWTFAPYDFRSSMAAGVIPYTDIRAADYPAEAASQAFAELKRLRGFWLGDFHSLVPLTDGEHDWCAYQCDRPDLGAGFAMFLRRHLSPFPGMVASLKGIDAKARYEVLMSPAYEQGPPVRMSGAELACMAVTIPDRPGSLLVEYRRLDRA